MTCADGSSAPCGHYSGDGGPPTSAQINLALHLAVDARNRVFIADTANSRIRVVDYGFQFAITSLSRLTNGHVLLGGVGTPGASYAIEGSADMSASFLSVGSVATDSAGGWQFEDANAASLGRRFYRLAVP